VLFAARLHTDTGVERRNASERANRKSLTNASAALLTERFTNMVRKLGTASDARIATIATTIINSINVNPRLRFFIAWTILGKLTQAQVQADIRQHQSAQR
jgi:hypothetical protein